MPLESLITAIVKWAASRDDLRALALVGSYARGDARRDSDVDLVLLSADPARYLRDTSWVENFGEVVSLSLEDWGIVQSVRVFYRDGLEVEFGLAPLDWAGLPPDPGTAEVLRDGVSILLDRDGALARLVQFVRRSA